MSDVEKICEQNYNRVKWANEYVDQPEAVSPVPSRKNAKAWEKHKSMWSATIACSAACGAGATFVGIGVTEMNPAAIIIGAAVVLVFLATGYAAEAAAEKAMKEALTHE